MYPENRVDAPVRFRLPMRKAEGFLRFGPLLIEVDLDTPDHHAGRPKPDLDVELYDVSEIPINDGRIRRNR